MWFYLYLAILDCNDLINVSPFQEGAIKLEVEISVETHDPIPTSLGVSDADLNVDLFEEVSAEIEAMQGEADNGDMDTSEDTEQDPVDTANQDKVSFSL